MRYWYQWFKIDENAIGVKALNISPRNIPEKEKNIDRTWNNGCVRITGRVA